MAGNAHFRKESTMMVSENPPSKPNDTIFIEDTSITHIDNQCLSTPCLVRVTLSLYPTIMCCIDSDNLPIWLVNRQNRPFFVTLNNGCNIKVFLRRYDLNNLFFGSSKDTFKGSLVPHKTPCTVIQTEIQTDAWIRSVSFSVLNFNAEFHLLGVAEMKHGGWQIKITEDPTFYENEKLLNQDDGYAVTHTGIIQRCDGETFCVKEAEHVLRGLRAFLSFARGSACGLTLVKAVDQDDREMVLEWGTTHTESWSQGRIAWSWLPTRDGGDNLSQLFSGFWRLYDDSDWRDTICTVIDWYLNSNNSPLHVGIILAQAALESICYKIVGNIIKEKESLAEFLRASLEKIEINNEIPESFQDLKNFSTQKVCQKRGQDYKKDGPEAIVEIRNDLIHKKKSYGGFSVEVQMDALHLSLWYLEVILLRKFEYSGQYMNRLRIADEDPFENVPWINGNLELSAAK